jgi:hypothetical protein
VDIRQRQGLIVEFAQQAADGHQGFRTKGFDPQFRQVADEGQELHRPPDVVTSQEPSVSFRDHQRGRHQRRRV